MDILVNESDVKHLPGFPFSFASPSCSFWNICVFAMHPCFAFVSIVSHVDQTSVKVRKQTDFLLKSPESRLLIGENRPLPGEQLHSPPENFSHYTRDHGDQHNARTILAIYNYLKERDVLLPG